MKIFFKMLTLIALMLLFNISSYAQTANPKATWYYAGEPGSGWGLAIGERLTDKKARTVRYIAVTRDLERRGFKLGDTVMVESKVFPFLNGKWRIMDRMSKRLHNRIDFLIQDKSIRKRFTRPVNVTIAKIN